LKSKDNPATQKNSKLNYLKKGKVAFFLKQKTKEGIKLAKEKRLRKDQTWRDGGAGPGAPGLYAVKSFRNPQKKIFREVTLGMLAREVRKIKAPKAGKKTPPKGHVRGRAEQQRKKRAQNRW